jgi:ubiquinone biosynthesis protein COQ9
MTQTIDETRAALLQAALMHVPFDGWGWRAMQAGAEDLGLDRAALDNAFPGGPSELIETYFAEVDRRMLEVLEAKDFSQIRLPERVAFAVRLRLDLIAPHREAVRRGLSFLALPQNTALSLKLLYRAVDAIWHGVGDHSTDYTFYSKRLLLAGVYSSTLLVWLNDRSEGHADTWAFLERRIDDVIKVGPAIGRTMDSLLGFPEKLVRRRAPGPRG